MWDCVIEEYMQVAKTEDFKVEYLPGSDRGSLIDSSSKLVVVGSVGKIQKDELWSVLLELRAKDENTDNRVNSRIMKPYLNFAKKKFPFGPIKMQFRTEIYNFERAIFPFLLGNKNSTGNSYEGNIFMLVLDAISLKVADTCFSS